MFKKIEYHFEKFKKGSGKQILVFTSILVLNPSSGIFAVPLYILGLIFIWNTKMSRKLKYRWSILPLIIAGILTLIIEIIYEIDPSIFPFLA